MKKILALVACLSLVASLAIGGSIAYLTDRDSEANVFTMGDVSIDLKEEFTQGEQLLPNKPVNKKPTIENIGKTDAYVWATVAYPQGFDTAKAAAEIEEEIIKVEYSDSDKWDNVTIPVGEAEIEGVKYNVYTFLYKDILTDENPETVALLSSVVLNRFVDIDPNGNLNYIKEGKPYELGWNLEQNGNLTIYVSAYGIQAEGFNSVADAYNAYQGQWGDNGVEWGKPSTPISANDDVSDAIKEGGIFAANGNINDDVIETNSGTTTEIDLQNNTMTSGSHIQNNGNLIVSNGTIKGTYIRNEGNATFENVDMNAGTADNYASINIGEGNVTVYDEVNIPSGGGGIGIVDGAEVLFKRGSVIIEGTTTNPRYNFYLEGTGSKLTIEDGTFDFDAKTLKRAYIYAPAGTTVEIKGGTFGAASTRYPEGIRGEGTITITGGTFGFDPSAWVAEGYQAVESNGTWTVSAK